jgi:lipopolysaccharide export system permease protein
MILFNNFVLPETNHRFASLMTSIHRKSPTARITPGVFLDDFDNYSLLVRQLDDRTGEMSDITIYDYTKGESPTTILASKGHMRFLDGGATLELELVDGEIHEVPGDRRDGKYRRLFFDRQTLYLTNPGAVLQRTDRQGRGEREMNIADLREQIVRLESQIETRGERLEEKAVAAGFSSYAAFETARGTPANAARLLRLILGRPSPQPPDTMESSTAQGKALEAVHVERLEIENLRRRIDNYDVEIHKKFSIPFACVVFVLLGGSLGIRMRRGGFANMAVSVAFFMIYYLFLIGGEQLADRRLMAPWLAMWMPNIVLGSLGIYLTASVTGLGPSRGMR